MGSARVAIAVGTASVVGAILILTGVAHASVVTAAALILGARTAALAAAPSATATRALTRHATLVVAWVSVVLVGSLRAGSAQVGDIRGAHAVAGLGAIRGSVLMVLAVWLAAAAAIAAVAAAASDGTSAAGISAVDGRPVVLDGVATLAQVGLIVTLVAGPQVSRWLDLVAWFVAFVIAGASIVAARRAARADALQRFSIGIGALALVIALAGGAA